jgi:hypothetical protein
MSMSPEQWTAVRDLIGASWPSLTRVLNVAATEREWRMSLAGAEYDVIRCAVVDLRRRYAENDNGKTTPVLGAIEQAVRQESRKRNAAARLEAGEPERESMSLDEWERIRIAEAKAYAEAHPTDIDLGERIAGIRAEGPFLRRANGLNDGSDTRALNAWWAATFGTRKRRGKGGPESLSELLAGTPMPAPEPERIAPTVIDSVAVDVTEIAAAADEVFATMLRDGGAKAIDWQTVSAPVRERVRELAEAHRKQSVGVS